MLLNDIEEEVILNKDVKKIIIFAISLMMVVLVTLVAIIMLKAKNPEGYKKIALIILLIEFVGILILYYLISKDKIRF